MSKNNKINGLIPKIDIVLPNMLPPTKPFRVKHLQTNVDEIIIVQIYKEIKPVAICICEH